MVKLSERVRNFPRGFQERQAARDRLPVWAKLAQFLIWLPTWLSLAFIWFVLFVSIQHLVNPQASEKELSFGIAIIAFSALFGTMPIGLMLTNLVLWSVPPLRRVNELSGKGVPGVSFKDATEDLISIAQILMPISAVAGFVGA
jgi:hypothetical protein